MSYHSPLVHLTMSSCGALTQQTLKKWVVADESEIGFDSVKTLAELYKIWTTKNLTDDSYDSASTLAELVKRGKEKFLNDAQIKMQLLFLAMAQFIRGDNIQRILERSRPDFVAQFFNYLHNFEIVDTVKTGLPSEINLARLAECFAYQGCMTLHNGKCESVISYELPNEYPKSMRSANFASLIPGPEVDPDVFMKLMTAHLAHQCLYDQIMNVKEKRSPSNVLAVYQAMSQQSKLYSTENRLIYLKNLGIVTGEKIILNENIAKFADENALKIIEEHDQSLNLKTRSRLSKLLRNCQGKQDD